MKSDKRRSSQERLRDAANTLFAEQGYEATTISQITKAAGTSYSQFLKYFSGKEQLRAEMLDEQWSQLNTAVLLATTGAPSGVEKLKLALNMFISFLEGNPSFRTMVLLDRVISREPTRISVNRGYREFTRILDDIFEAMNGGGELLPRSDVQALRSGLMGSLEGMLRDRLLAEKGDYPAQYSEEQVRSVIMSFLTSHLDIQRPGAASIEAPRQKLTPAAELAAGDDDWIRYYLALADKALGPAEMA